MITGIPVGQTVTATGNVAAPGANGAVATIAAGSLPAGLWHFAFYYGYGAVAPVLDDMKIRFGGADFLTLRIPAVINANGEWPIEIVRQMDGATNAQLTAIAGAAGNYVGTIVATPIRS